MRAYSYLHSAEAIIQTYDGRLPLAAWLKAYFREHKKFGSRDRKEIAHACYSYYRGGRLFAGLPVTEVLLRCLLLSPGPSQEILQSLRPEWIEWLSRPLEEKLSFLGVLQLRPIFPLHAHLGEAIDEKPFLLSHLVQPNLHLRLRPGREAGVLGKIKASGLPYATCGPQCLALPNGSKVEDLIALNHEAVVQDRSSQEVLHMLEGYLDPLRPFSAWDCCTASGGKAIQLADMYPHARLTVSDIRESILVNLRKRFTEAGIRSYRSFVADVGGAPFAVPGTYDLVVCDAPCSGSGTWSRTPEQLHFFRDTQIGHYTDLQESIALHAAQQVKAGGYFLYITCSVFEAENEGMVKKLSAAMSLEKSAYCKGYRQKADTLFAALFRKL